jgi:glycosyltransferase involved in cell wall biosynthesis
LSAEPGRPLVVALNTLINPANAGGSESSALSILANFRDAGPADIDLRVTALGAYAGRMTGLRGDPDKVIVWPWPEFTPVSSQPSEPWLRELRARLGDGLLGGLFDHASRAVNEKAHLKTMPSRADVDALLDKSGVDVVHFTYPVKWPTRRPWIYEPHDIQQHHFPEFFSPDVLAWRARTYAEGIRGAAFVVCGTWWTKRDIMRCYGVGADKVAVIPRSSTMARAELSPEREAEAAAQAGLPECFMFYPAMTFPHKNHLKLLEAMALLRQRRGLKLQLVCTGRPYAPFHPKLVEAADRLGLREQVRFLGVVSDELLAACYRRCRFVVFPSLLEGHSQALLEALWHRRPIVAASQSSVPETVGEAGLLFDATDVEAIAGAIEQAWDDDALLADLAARSEGSFDRYRWDRALTTLSACYKTAAGRRISPDERAALDRALLASRPADG